MDGVDGRQRLLPEWQAPLLRGANVHQDHAGWGDAVTEAGMWRDVRMMKEAGYSVERIPGPPGKREMLRAIKL